MSCDVLLQVSFKCTARNVKEIASKELELLPQTYQRESRQFLEALADGKCVNDARNGEWCTWGILGNYCNADSFIEDLKEFWPYFLDPFSKIIVFKEQIFTAQCYAYVIEMINDGFKTTVFECPFSWQD